MVLDSKSYISIDALVVAQVLFADALILMN